MKHERVPKRDKPRRSPWRLLVAVLLVLSAVWFRFAMLGYKTTAYCLVALAAFFVLWHCLLKRKIARRILFSVAILGVLAIAVAEIPVIAASRGDDDASAPYLVVLGAGVNGNVPSLSLVDRLKAAAVYLEAHPNAVAILSGGQGDGESIAESKAMFDWLTARGIDPARLIQEDKATSTEENLAFSFDIIRARGDDPADGVAIVSSEYHLYRAKQMAKKQGAIPYGVAAQTHYWTLEANYFLREAFAVWYLWIFG